EKQLTLGTLAPLLAGAVGVGQTGLAARLAAVLDEQFAAYGYPRVARGGLMDAAVAMTAPGFVGQWPPGAREAALGAETALLTPAGGLAPGERWGDKSVAWTPETALFAYAWASGGEPHRATRWLVWLDEHRTPHGALPERVDASGQPIGPAPLAWTAALVVLTQHELGALVPAAQVFAGCDGTSRPRLDVVAARQQPGDPVTNRRRAAARRSRTGSRPRPAR
ncbi:MAG: hypothetical protein FWE61_01495, partial [Micrococcales bacterium]|nr:hypothetical protein [Micrococcales bacterium]